MAKNNIGAAIPAQTSATMLAAIRHAEGAGVPTMWLTTGAGPDAMTIFAAAAAVTQRIRMARRSFPLFRAIRS